MLERRAGFDRRRLARIFGFPFYALDLSGSDGRPSFAKLVTSSVLLSYFVGHPVPVGSAIVVIASSFGAKMFREFLLSKTVTSHEEVKADLKDLLARRDPKEGIDPAP